MAEDYKADEDDFILDNSTRFQYAPPAETDKIIPCIVDYSELNDVTIRNILIQVLNGNNDILFNCDFKSALMKSYDPDVLYQPLLALVYIACSETDDNSLLYPIFMYQFNKLLELRQEPLYEIPNLLKLFYYDILCSVISYIPIKDSSCYFNDFISLYPSLLLRNKKQLLIGLLHFKIPGEINITFIKNVLSDIGNNEDLDSLILRLYVKISNCVIDRIDYVHAIHDVFIKDEDFPVEIIEKDEFDDEAKAIATDYFILFKCTICDDLLENKPTCIDTNSEEIRNILELHSLFCGYPKK